MEPQNAVLTTYTIIGIIFIIFNKKFAELNYKFTLYYTKKLKVDTHFIFKIDKKNKEAMFFLTRSFAALFGLFLSVSALYFLCIR